MLRSSSTFLKGLMLAWMVLAGSAIPLLAQEEAPAAEAVAAAEVAAPAEAAAPAAEAPALKSAAYAEGDKVDILWTLLAAILVFFMQAGFAMVEAGFTRAKNAVNIMMKNLLDFSVGSLAFFFVGFGIMFGAGNGWFGSSELFMLGETSGGQWGFVFFIFQAVFAATAATIVSGGVAGRTKFTGYLAYSVVICAFIYPVFGSWAWGGLLDGGGWLEGIGFLDFAGSTVVHSVGGWLALAGAIVIGPRLGKYTPEGKAKAIPGHNIPLAALGVFILWMGWFGFNAGSTTAAGGDTARIAVTTCLSASAGVITAMLLAWIMFKKPDASMALNGALAGLVGITAACDCVSPMSAIIIGGIAGLIVVLSVVCLDRILKIDDPVGAVSVHGVCGAWGTIAVALFHVDGFSMKQLGVQLVGVGAAFAWAFGTGMILFLVIKHTIGLRAEKEDEMRGLDISEHGMEAYNGFQIFSNE